MKNYLKYFLTFAYWTFARKVCFCQIGVGSRVGIAIEIALCRKTVISVTHTRAHTHIEAARAGDTERVVCVLHWDRSSLLPYGHQLLLLLVLQRGVWGWVCC